ncbi:IclR family transcriptional regulator (plasmid) [Prescottella equi]|uniref:IclR family transcriptional regulator n=1 Tax=Rhodococcus hoagii TaxID=43767 RepID=UPI0025778DA1|nr:IclR family transcriptional regulator [Prescottella equi]WJJ14589.1 IclR family transcriptional regulator [Prescottella equi]
MERALNILCELAKADIPVGISEISRRTGYSKSTVHLSLRTMHEMNFVVQDPESGRYGLGLAAAQLGVAAQENSQLVAMLSAPMSDLAVRSNEAVSLGVRVDSEVLFIKRFETSYALGTNIREGTRMPLHTSASGKALLMGMSNEEIRALFPDEHLPHEGSHADMHRAQLLEEIEKARQIGYVTSSDEWRLGISAAAVPVQIGNDVVASVSIAGPTSRFRADLWVTDLLALAGPLTRNTNRDR